MRFPKLFLLFLLSIIFGLMLTRPDIGWRIQSFFSRTEPRNSLESLKEENMMLKAELAGLADVKRQISLGKDGGIPAAVYARDRLNFKSELLLGIGRDRGRRGMTVSADGFLLGKVIEVFEETSLVKTIFDPSWQSAVRLGSGIEGLLRGGSRPSVTLIEKESLISPGDIVYSASEEFPYGMPLGEVGEIMLSKDKLFQEAYLKIPYSLNAVRAVLLFDHGK